MRTILGHSDQVESLDAIDEIIETCLARLDGELPKAATLFASVDYEHSVLLAQLAKRWPGMPVIGGSTDGELSTEAGFCHDSALLTLFAGDDLEVHAGLGKNLSAGIDSAAASTVEGFRPGRSNIGLSVFAPTTNGSQVVRAINQRLGTDTPFFGGLSGDHRTFTQTREFFGTEVLSDSLPLLVLSGDFDYGWGLESGWFPVGDEHEITRAEGHEVFEIDGRPALEVYEAQYGMMARNSLGEYPLAVYDNDDWSLRTIMRFDRETNVLSFAGEVPQGARVRITEVLPEGILSGTAKSLETALDTYSGSDPQLAMIFSCAARKWVLGTQAEREIDELRTCAQDQSVPDLSISGLYCYGEIAPHRRGETSSFHNETCISLVVGH